jgi:hypothetical protein
VNYRFIRQHVTVDKCKQEAWEAREAEDSKEAVEAVSPEALAAALKEAGERLTEAIRHDADTTRVSS